MNRRFSIQLYGIACLAAWLCAAAGCVKVNTLAQIQQSSSLAEQKTGMQPGWTSTWDDESPTWTPETILTLDEALQYALRNNRELRAEVEEVGKAQADLIQAGLLQNPMLTLGAKLPSGGGRAMFEGGLIPFQGLRDLWLIPTRKKAADAALQETVLRVADLAVSTAAQVKVLYARIQYSQRAIELTRDSLALVDQSVELIESRRVVGQTTTIEVNTERIRRLRLQSDLIALEAEHRKLKQELLLLMGFPEASDSWRTSPISDIDTDIAALPPIEVLISHAQTSRLDLCAARWSVWAAGHEIAVSRGEAWPAFDIGITFEREAAPRSQNISIPARAGNALVGGLTGNDPMPPSIEPFGPASRDPKWLVGPMFEMSIPIFDQNQAQITKAVHELRRRYALHAALEQKAIQRVRELHLMYQQAAEQVRLFRDSIIPEVKSNQELIQRAYQAGSNVFTDYLRSQEDLIAVQLLALGFVRDAAVSRVELEREAGGRLP